MSAKTNRLSAADLVAASRRPAPVVATEQRAPISARVAVFTAEVEASFAQYRVVKNLVRASAEEVIAMDNIAFINSYRVSNGLEPL